MKTHALILLLASLIARPLSGEILYTEEFETDGNGSRYFANEFNDGLNDYFTRTAGGLGQFEDYAYTGLSPSDIFFTTEDTDASENTLDADLSVLRLQPIDVSGYTDLEVSIELAIGSDDPFSSYDSSSFIVVQYAFDSDIGAIASGFDPSDDSDVEQLDNNGSYTDVIRFVGDGVAGGTMVGTGSSLNFGFDSYSGTIAGTGGFLSVQVSAFVTGGEEIAFDNIQISGTQAVPEPSVAVLLVGLFAAGVVGVRRRSTKRA